MSSVASRILFTTLQHLSFKEDSELTDKNEAPADILVAALQEPK